ncbi:MAG: M18 family aminopeptidase [Buchananella hordeovulneris]|nr:M18 family aminopeptidase [Buchananella hordeovulneris]
MSFSIDSTDYCAALADFVQASPSSYHAAAEVARQLKEVGFTALVEEGPWREELPNRGLVVRDGAVIAWMLPAAVDETTGFRVVGSHTDSPALKLKPAGALSREGYGLVNAEIYGGPLLNSWLDREVGLAGRLVTKEGHSQLVKTGPIARTAQLAPHLDRSVNEKLTLDRQGHMLPIFGMGAFEPRQLETLLCRLAGIEPDELGGFDVFTYTTEAPARFGVENEFFASSRLDNLSSVFASLTAFLAAARGEFPLGGDVLVLAAFDHEEVGSETRSGAAGPFLADVLSRLSACFGWDDAAARAAIARSSCVSADAGHAVHPNYASMHDPSVRPLLGGGPLLKINANQRYVTDARGAALWLRACQAAGVPSQEFVSNNSVPCGSTIGPITATRLGMVTVDVGQPLLAMHSAREMAGVEDGPMFSRALAAYWAGA